MHYIKTSLYLSSKEPQNVFKGKSIWEPVGILMQKWQTVKTPEFTARGNTLELTTTAPACSSSCEHMPHSAREEVHAPPPRCRQGAGTYCTWLLCQTGGGSSGGRRAWLVTARLLVRSPGFLLARVSRCPRARRPHLNCSRRAGCRLAWLTLPRVCEWMHEWVSGRQYRKAL